MTTSGGKDSSVCVALAERAGIPFEVMHRLTTADAPETVYFIREEFRRLEAKGIKCGIEYPLYKGERTSMWKFIPQKLITPTRLVRYCCSILKEDGSEGKFIITGIRWAESKKRRDTRGQYEILGKTAKQAIILNNDNDDRRRWLENCRPKSKLVCNPTKSKLVCNPIIDWTDRDVWGYMEAERLPVNPLYPCGFSHVGCIGCPMAGTKRRQKEFARYPKYQRNYILAFDRMLDERKRKRLSCGWTSGEDVFHWWMKDGVLPGQLNFDDLAELMEDDEE